MAAHRSISSRQKAVVSWPDRAREWLMAAATDDTVESQPEPRAKPLGRFLDYGCGGCGLLETVRHLSCV
ncbi:MAG: hypothetical protein ACE5EX_09605 [Phycisphaerae bacterium]